MRVLYGCNARRGEVKPPPPGTKGPTVVVGRGIDRVDDYFTHP